TLPIAGRQVRQVAASGSRLYAVVSSGLATWVYATGDAGAHWTLIHKSANLESVAVDPLHSATVFVQAIGGLARSTDAGAHFTAPRKGPGAPVFDAVRPGWLYALGNGRSWRSTDGGLTWRAFAKFHGLTLNSLIPDPQYGGVVYADARLGGKGVVGRSTDAAASFSSMPSETSLNAPAVVADRVIADGPSFSGGLEMAPAVYGWTIDDVTPPGFALPPYPRLVEGTTLGATAVVKEAWNGYDLDTGVASYAVQRATGTGAPVPVPLDTPLTKERLFSIPVGLDTTIQVADTDGAGNASLFRGPRFSVQKIEDGSTVLPLGLHWLRATNRDATAGHLRYATAPGSAFSLTFAGRAIAWVAPRSPQRGQAAVYVDGVKVKTVALGGAASIKPRQVVFAKSWATRGTHTLKVVVLARPAGSSTRVDVDALLLIPLLRLAVDRRDVPGRRGLAACYARAGRGVGDGGGHVLDHRLVEHRRDDVVLVQLVLGDDTRDRPRRGQVHLLVDRRRLRVERTAEHPGEAQHVVDLVRVVRATGGDHPGDALDLLRRHLGRRVGHREHDRVLGHALDRLDRDGAGA